MKLLTDGVLSYLFKSHNKFHKNIDIFWKYYINVIKET